MNKHFRDVIENADLVVGKIDIKKRVVQIHLGLSSHDFVKRLNAVFVKKVDHSLNYVTRDTPGVVPIAFDPGEDEADLKFLKKHIVQVPAKVWKDWIVEFEAAAVQ